MAKSTPTTGGKLGTRPDSYYGVPITDGRVSNGVLGCVSVDEVRQAEDAGVVRRCNNDFTGKHYWAVVSEEAVSEDRGGRQSAIVSGGHEIGVGETFSHVGRFVDFIDRKEKKKYAQDIDQQRKDSLSIDEIKTMFN